MRIFGVGDFWFLSAMCISFVMSKIIIILQRNFYGRFWQMFRTEYGRWGRNFLKKQKKWFEGIIIYNSQFTANLNHIILLRFCFAYDILQSIKIKTNSMPSISLSKTAPFAILGCILSAYALYVEHKVANKPEEEEFSAFCDIELIGASCR